LFGLTENPRSGWKLSLSDSTGKYKGAKKTFSGRLCALVIYACLNCVFLTLCLPRDAHEQLGAGLELQLLASLHR
jgi:hypothetical protein